MWLVGGDQGVGCFHLELMHRLDARLDALGAYRASSATACAIASALAVSSNVHTRPTGTPQRSARAAFVACTVGMAEGANGGVGPVCVTVRSAVPLPGRPPVAPLICTWPIGLRGHAITPPWNVAAASSGPGATTSARRRLRHRRPRRSFPCVDPPHEATDRESAASAENGVRPTRPRLESDGSLQDAPIWPAQTVAISRAEPRSSGPGARR
jgi:hypothetical protein